MKGKFTVSLQRIIKEFALETLVMPQTEDELLIQNT